jgi:xanthosine utilization system XapX-like protein
VGLPRSRPIRQRRTEALARFPASPAITFLLGRHGLLVGDHAEALQFHDRTLATEPAHDQALLGRTIGRKRVLDSAAL